MNASIRLVATLFTLATLSACGASRPDALDARTYREPLVLEAATLRDASQSLSPLDSHERLKPAHDRGATLVSPLARR